MKVRDIRLLCSAACLFAVSLLTPLGAAAQSAAGYPSKSVKIIVGYAAGGATDVHARILAEGLTKLLGQTFYVENRPGATGVIAADQVAKSAPDGYTLMVATSGALAIPQNFGKLPYDPVKDFIPVAQITTNDLVLVVNNNFPAKNFAEFVQVLKANPQKYSYGVSGKGSITHISGERLKRLVGIDMQVLPYKGDSQAMTDTIGGASPISLVALASVSALVKSGQARPLVVTGSQRLKYFPDIPTVMESGYPDFVASSWIALFAPAGTSPEIVKLLGDASRKAMSDTAVIDRLESTGTRMAGKTSQELSAFMGKEIIEFAQVIRAADIKPD